MEKSPLISVIVPIYNVADYLPRCVDSILAQTYTNLEIILVDDGSTDNSPQLCDTYAKKDPRIKVVHQRNKGLPGARNSGLAAMQGEFFTFVDGDDWIDKTCYQQLMELQQKTQADMVSCALYYASDEKMTERLLTPVAEPGFLAPTELLLLLLQQENFSACNKIFCRRWVGQTRFDAHYTIAEDWAFVSQLAKKGGRVAHLNAPLYFYYQRPHSMIHTGSSQGWYSATQLALGLYNEFKESPSEALRTRLLGSLLSFAGAFSLVALLNHVSPTDVKLLQAREILKTHIRDIIKTHAMGVLGKSFAFLFIASPKLIAWSCGLPGINGLLKKAFAKTR